MRRKLEQQTMQTARTDEQSRTWFRSDRVYLLSDNAWYFRTREGVEIGPYDSQFEAEIEANLLKELLKVTADEAETRAVIREFVVDSHQMGQTLQPVCPSVGKAVFA